MQDMWLHHAVGTSASKKEQLRRRQLANVRAWAAREDSRSVARRRREVAGSLHPPDATRHRLRTTVGMSYQPRREPRNELRVIRGLRHHLTHWGPDSDSPIVFL